MIPIIGLALGLLLGAMLPYDIPEEYSLYVAIAILVALDTVLGGYISVYQGRFSFRTFFSGVLGNGLIALVMAFIGEQMNVPLYLAPVFFFGNRLFNNFSTLRRLVAAERERKKADRKAKKLLEEAMADEDSDA